MMTLALAWFGNTHPERFGPWVLAFLIAWLFAALFLRHEQHKTLSVGGLSPLAAAGALLATVGLFISGLSASGMMGDFWSPVAVALGIETSALPAALRLANRHPAPGRPDVYRLEMRQVDIFRGLKVFVSSLATSGKAKLAAVSAATLVAGFVVAVFFRSIPAAGFIGGLIVGGISAFGISKVALLATKERADLASQLAAVLGVNEQSVHEGQSRWWKYEAGQVIIVSPPATVLASLPGIEARLVALWPEMAVVEQSASRIVIGPADEQTMQRRAAAEASGGLFTRLPGAAPGDQAIFADELADDEF